MPLKNDGCRDSKKVETPCFILNARTLVLMNRSELSIVTRKSLLCLYMSFKVHRTATTTTTATTAATTTTTKTNAYQRPYVIRCWVRH